MVRSTFLLLVLSIGGVSLFLAEPERIDGASVMPLAKPTPPRQRTKPTRPTTVATPRSQTTTNTPTTTDNGQQPNRIYGDVYEGTGIKTKQKNSAASSVPANNANTTQGQTTVNPKRKKPKRPKN